MFTKKTIKDIDLTGKRVLLRADYNVPVKNGVVVDDYRIKQSLPTVQYILDQPDTSLVIISHLGRPVGNLSSDLSLEPVAEHLASLLKKKVRFVNECIGEGVKKAVSTLEPGGVIMLENLRFNELEEKNDISFAQSLVSDSGAQVFVQDGFGVVHRAHSSTQAITKNLPSVSGLLLEKEVQMLSKAMADPARPLVAVVGGAKISDKLDILYRFINIADVLAVGGAMANNFLAAQGYSIGKSLIEEETLEKTKEILETAQTAQKARKFSFLLPVDAVVSSSADGTKPTRIVDFAGHITADITSYPKAPPEQSYTVGQNEMMLDIGPISAGQIAGAVKASSSVIWNGPLGMAEVKGIAGAANPFAHGTKLVAEAIAGEGRNHVNRPLSIVGGGDTAAYVQSNNLIDEFDLVSTGGGAGLELLAGKELPGVAALEDK